MSISYNYNLWARVSFLIQLQAAPATLLKKRLCHLLFVHFQEYLPLFLGDKVDEKANNFQIAKVQSRGVS